MSRLLRASVLGTAAIRIGQQTGKPVGKRIWPGQGGPAVVAVGWPEAMQCVEDVVWPAVEEAALSDPWRK